MLGLAKTLFYVSDEWGTNVRGVGREDNPITIVDEDLVHEKSENSGNLSASEGNDSQVLGEPYIHVLSATPPKAITGRMLTALLERWCRVVRLQKAEENSVYQAPVAVDVRPNE